MLIKHPYELSTWVEQLEDGIKSEQKGVIIGAHDMTYLGKATNIKLKREIKGTNTLTFDMPSKYFDSKIGDYVYNDLVDTLMAETKIKLFYKDKWYEFLIKKITENKKFKAIMYSYSCQDSFIDELSRIGYDIEFAPELNNSVSETGDFMEEILEDSIWDYRPEYNIGDFTEYNEQKFYRIPLKQFGGKIKGYKINLEVKRDMFLTDDSMPKIYLQKKLQEENKDWTKMSQSQKNQFIDQLMMIINVFTNETRDLEYGDDLAREREIFWDCYYKDNGAALLSEDNEYVLEGEYIYVPITDLSMIMGSIYENAYSAVEEPALYGNYMDKNTHHGYALQPSSLNPHDLIQFIFLKDGDVFHIDDANVLSDNDFHYVIPIEDWNNILKERLGDEGLIYWTSPISSDANANMTNKYSYATDGDTIYTTDTRPNSSVIDKFNWYPVYYDNYLSDINGTEITMARKISVTDRTEYNKAADMYVTVYQNESDEYVNGDEDLYTEPELTDRVKSGEEFRVCSKLKTRQILPTLARNLVQNGTEITDTNGWESKTQNINSETILGTGSYKSLMDFEVHPTFNSDASDTVNIQNLTGSYEDEVVSDYYLKILSPKLNKCIDFSKEGSVEFDYALNFGLISQDYQIEKDKVYAIRIKTGDMVNEKVTFSYRGNDKTLTAITDKEEIVTAVNIYEKTIDDYYNMITAFGRDKNNAMKIIQNIIGTKEEIKQVNDFYNIVSELNKGGKESEIEKLKNSVDEKLTKILKELIEAHKSKENNEYEKFSNIAILPKKSTSSLSATQSYRNSDVNYLKYYLYTKVPTITEREFNYVSGLTRAVVNNWKKEYITYDKKFNERINEDLDKIIIGKGCLNSKGNYVVEGTEGDSGDEFISFKDVFEIQNNLYYVPNNITDEFKDLSNKEKLTKQIYHYKRNGKWHYSDKEIKDSLITIKDDVFLLFKANQTITNPYIGIRVDSSPMKINFDNVEKTTYAETTSSGVIINIKKHSNEYLDNVKIELVRVDTKTTTDEFRDSIGFDKEKGTFNTNLKSFTFKDEDLKSKRVSWSGVSSVENPVIDSAFLLSENENKTIPYLVFLNGKCFGLIYLERGDNYE